MEETRGRHPTPHSASIRSAVSRATRTAAPTAGSVSACRYGNESGGVIIGRTPGRENHHRGPESRAGAAHRRRNGPNSM
ncbi:hypothetical protein YW3DRAFT_02557 [Streptomyces sp. MnatMP-M77]|nr:hypothetical protein YW3DRAFT_02557 [Streptomyces sp. MnatMP-M77]